MERELNQRPHKTADDLRTTIILAMDDFKRDTMAKAHRRFWLMLEAVVESFGNLIKTK